MANYMSFDVVVAFTIPQSHSQRPTDCTYKKPLQKMYTYTELAILHIHILNRTTRYAHPVGHGNVVRCGEVVASKCLCLYARRRDVLYMLMSVYIYCERMKNNQLHVIS